MAFELETVKFLKNHHPNGFNLLTEKFAISATEHPNLPILLLKYSQINSPKTNPIVKECRTLILEKDTYKVVSRAFPRFFNLGEDPTGEKNFNWWNFVVQEKIDGSKINLFYYGGKWHLSTSGSFGFGEILDTQLTWYDLIWPLLSEEKLEGLRKDFTYVFEFCSPLTKVVRYYPKPTLYLIGIFDNNTLEEMSFDALKSYAGHLNVNLPTLYSFSSAQQCIESLETEDPQWKTEPTFEGYVLVDENKNRLKVKSRSYIALSQLNANGNIFLGKNLIKLIMDKPGEKSEITLYFPEVLPYYEYYEGEINNLFEELDEIYLLYNDLEKKKYAMAIKGEPKLRQCILFAAYKKKENPSKIKREFTNYIIEFLPKKEYKNASTSDLLCNT